jgi:hypothetical protein
MAQVLSEFLIGFSPMVVSVVIVVGKVTMKQVFLRACQFFLASYGTMLHAHNATGTGTAGYSTTRDSLVAVPRLTRQ